MSGGGLRIILCDGCFDPLHFGHLMYFKEAKALGGFLVVAVTEDESIKKPGHPVFNQEQRLEMVKALRCVDAALLVSDGMYAVKLIRPEVYVKGAEYAGRLAEQEFVESYGGKVHFTSGPVYSSTKLLSGGYFQTQGVSSR